MGMLDSLLGVDTSTPFGNGAISALLPQDNVDPSTSHKHLYYLASRGNGSKALSYVPPNSDPYQPSDRDIEASRYADRERMARENAQLKPQSPIPFAGMLNESTGPIAPPSGLLHVAGDPSNPATDMSPGTAPSPAGSPFDTSTDPVQFANAPMPMSMAPGASAMAMEPPGPTQPAQPPVQRTPSAAPAETPGSSFLSRVSNTLAQHPTTLLALGAGLAGAPTFGQGMSRAFAAAVPAAKQDIDTNMRQQSISETFKALVSQGVSPNEALAAVYNPDILKAMIPRLYGKSVTWDEIGRDSFGNPVKGFVDTNNQTLLSGNQVTKPKVGRIEDALRLPKGTHFIDPDGIERVR
jgi:hypothetical protein